MPKVKEKPTYAVLVFPGTSKHVHPVLLGRYEDRGVTVNCKICMWDVDDVLDRPTDHQAQCGKENTSVIQPVGRKLRRD